MSNHAPVTIGHVSDVRELDDLEEQMAKLLTRAEEIEVRDDTGRDYAIEYLKRSSRRFKWIASLEGEDDELSLIGEVQITLGRRAFLKLNSGFGLTRKAPEFAPEVGVIISFGRLPPLPPRSP